MRIALQLAGLGEKRVHPNPKVGCVIVKNAKIIGKGYHEYFGGNHAEVNALRNAGNIASGSTLYVTLEPCSYSGKKTPPCTDSIIKAGIKRVVIGMKDPNPDVFGKGIAKLERNGITVTTGILTTQAKRLNKNYINSLKARKQYVILKMAMSLDGKIATRTGDSKWITGPKTRKFVHKLRSVMDGIIVGVNTVLKDDPELSSHGLGPNPVRIIIDPNLQIPLNSKVADGSISTIIIYSKVVKDKLEVLVKKQGIMAVKINSNNNNIDFKSILLLLQKYGIYKVILEGGGETSGKAIEDGIVDEVIFMVAPKIIGGRNAKTPVEGIGINMISKAVKLKNMTVTKIDKDLVIRGRI